MNTKYEDDFEWSLIDRPLIKIIVFKANNYNDFFAEQSLQFHEICDKCEEIKMNILLIYVPFSLQPQSNLLEKLSGYTKEENYIYKRLLTEFNDRYIQSVIFYPNDSDKNRWIIVNQKIIEMCFKTLHSRIQYYKSSYIESMYKYNNIDELTVHITPVDSPRRTGSISSFSNESDNSINHKSPISLNRNIPGNISVSMTLSRFLLDSIHTFTNSKLSQSPLVTISKKTPVGSPLNLTPKNSSIDELPKSMSFEEPFTPRELSHSPSHSEPQLIEDNIVLSEFYNNCDLLRSIYESKDPILLNNKDLNLNPLEATPQNISHMYEFFENFLRQMCMHGLSIKDSFSDLVKILENLKQLFSYYYDNLSKRHTKLKIELNDILFGIKEHLKKYGADGVKANYVKSLLYDTLISGYQLCTLYKKYGILSLPLPIYSDMFDLVVRV